METFWGIIAGLTSSHLLFHRAYKKKFASQYASTQKQFATVFLLLSGATTIFLSAMCCAYYAGFLTAKYGM
ncbi:MAG: hypothetical protein ACTTKI_05900 [Tannerella sp.]|uniref:hypothetical protein n=1 Tax=Tannerella sp. TaxID=2382127 RepID=UPI003FA34203